MSHASHASADGHHDSSATSGIVLLLCAVAAMVVANSPLSEWYLGALSTPVSVHIGAMSLEKPALLWINDGLMAMFFLLVGLELKREVKFGSLSTLRSASLPLAAAAGGIALPAIIFATLNWNDPVALQGWAIPAATDIAFALGVLALLGSSVPVALKVFLMAVAVIDDLGAIIIIAAFYTDSLSPAAFAIGGICIAILFAMNRLGVRSVAAYLLVGTVLWLGVLKSGVHATLAGVIIAAFIPCEQDEGSPAARLEQGLHEWVILLVLPMFALANAGVSLEGLSLETLLAPLPLGIALGLILGKACGVFGVGMLAIRLGWAQPLPGVDRVQMMGVSILCGIGFTMSLFITSLAFDPAAILLQAQAKLGVLGGSVIAGIIGYSLLRAAGKRRTAGDTYTTSPDAGSPAGSRTAEVSA